MKVKVNLPLGTPLKPYTGSIGTPTAPPLLNFGNGGEWFTSSPGRFAGRKEPWCPVSRRLCGPQSRSGHCSEGIVFYLGHPVMMYRRQAKIGKPIQTFVIFYYILYLKMVYSNVLKIQKQLTAHSSIVEERIVGICGFSNPLLSSL